jgi:hypothetical protein
MGAFKRKVPGHYVAVHPDNIAKNDWIILLEAGTIVGAPGERLRVAVATRERKFVKRYNIFLQAEHYLVLDGYDRRIHALYFCPQLYKYDADRCLVPLEAEEIGKLLARSVQEGVAHRAPWYDPLSALPDEPIIATNMKASFDTMVVVVEEETEARLAAE